MPPIDGSTLAERKTTVSDYARFIQAWVRQPRQTASIVPSSPWLGRLMAGQIDPAGGRVMELGGGTGSITTWADVVSLTTAMTAPSKNSERQQIPPATCVGIVVRNMIGTPFSNTSRQGRRARRLRG